MTWLLLVPSGKWEKWSSEKLNSISNFAVLEELKSSWFLFLLFFFCKILFFYERAQVEGRGRGRGSSRLRAPQGVWRGSQAPGIMTWATQVPPTPGGFIPKHKKKKLWSQIPSTPLWRPWGAQEEHFTSSHPDPQHPQSTLPLGQLGHYFGRTLLPGIQLPGQRPHRGGRLPTRSTPRSEYSLR